MCTCDRFSPHLSSLMAAISRSSYALNAAFWRRSGWRSNETPSPPAAMCSPSIAASIDLASTPPALVSSIRSCATWFAFRSSPPARTVSVFFVLPPTFFFPLFFPATASPKNPNVPASPPFFFFFASWPLRALPLRARRRVREGWMGTSERRGDGDEWGKSGWR